MWLSPEQAVVLNITDHQAEYAQKVAIPWPPRTSGWRLICATRKVGFKIREHTIQRIPYLLVVGDREMEEGSVAVRTRSR